MKRILALALSTIMAMSLFVGCDNSETTDKGTTDSGTTNEGNSDEKIQIRFSWWGSEARHEATLEAIEYYESQNPNVEILPEYAGWDGFQNKLMAQVAGQNAPDVFTCLTEWYPAINEVDGFYDLTGKIDTSGHSEATVKACSYDGKELGVNISLNAYGFVYNKTLLDELGIDVPTGDYTWDDLFAILPQVYEKSNGEIYGIPDLHSSVWEIEAYGLTALQRPWPYMWSDTEITMTGEDVVAYMNKISSLPENSMLPAAESVTIDQHTMSASANRQTAFEAASFGTFASMQSQTDDEMALLQYPVGPNGETANFARPGLILSVSNNSKNPEEAAKFIDFMTNSPEAAKILKTSRGVLPTVAQREAVLAEEGLLSPADMVVFDAVNKVFESETLPYLAGPLGAVEVREDVLKNIGQSVAFGKLTPEEAGPEFEKQVDLALNK